MIDTKRVRESAIRFEAFRQDATLDRLIAAEVVFGVIADSEHVQTLFGEWSDGKSFIAIEIDFDQQGQLEDVLTLVSGAKGHCTFGGVRREGIRIIETQKTLTGWRGNRAFYDFT